MILKAESPTTSIQPISLRQSSLIFAGFALLTLTSFMYLMPMLEENGYGHLLSFTVAFGIPAAVMFAVALGLYHRKDNFPLTRESFSIRMWYPRLKLKDIAVGFLIFIVSGAASALLIPLRNLLINTGIFNLPAGIPFLLDPATQISIEGLDQASGGGLVGRWDIALVYLIMYVFNIIGEEFLWRGYLLPRQIKQHGRFAWFIHGLQWAAFHLFKWWDIITILPLTLLFAYTSQRLKNNWPTLIAHSLGNLAFLLLVIGRVAGIVN